MIDDDLDRLLRKVITQWNIAEERIKKAEQVRGNEVVASAIFELRYAGRKIVDSLALAMDDDFATNAKKKDHVHEYLADAGEDCVKAKHDAIDAMMTFVTSWFERAEDSVGLSRLQQFFPDYVETTAMISEVQERISKSRGDRHGLRDGIYDDIDQKDGPYDKIIGLFSRMKKSNGRVEEVAKGERREKIWLWVITIVSLIIGVIGAIDPISKYWSEHFSVHDSAKTEQAPKR